jgi:UDP-2,3-diacylglucosamine pyrophosphatase LpxH
MKTIVTSDVHLGNPYCNIDAFDEFLDKIPQDYRLVINGDLVDGIYVDLPKNHRRVIPKLVKLHEENRLIWVMGNHDIRAKLKIVKKRQDLSKMGAAVTELIPQRSYFITNSVVISHGHDEDSLMYSNEFIFDFAASVYGLMVKFKLLPPIHVSEWAMGVLPFRAWVIKGVKSAARAKAKEHGCKVALVGHVHYPEYEDGSIIYMNTGHWLGDSPHMAIIGENITLLDKVSNIDKYLS